MREPRQLWSDLGGKTVLWCAAFVCRNAFAIRFGPVLWSFWLVPFGIYHPLEALLSPVGFWVLAGIFFASELVNLLVAAAALRSAGQSWLIKWALTL
jgi:hypothetical protein